MPENSNGNGSGKKRIAMYWAASCGGCDISFLEIGPRILDLIQIADVVFWPCAADFKYKDVAAYPDGHIDACFYNGGVRNSEQEEVARLLRKKSKTLVAYGACACDGGIPSLANLKTKAEIYEAAYHENPSTVNPEGVEPKISVETRCGEVTIPRMYDSVLRLKDVVEVDYELPGCPPQADRVWEAAGALLRGEVPARNNAIKVGCTAKSVCDECPREKKLVKVGSFKRPHMARPEPDWCLLEQGFVCSGPATRSGCGALCIKGGLPCRGCYGTSGTTEDIGTAMISAIGSILSAETEDAAKKMVGEIVDPVGTFYRFGLASGHLKTRK
jgi:F420-non-reducing hydrogenase small subunit